MKPIARMWEQYRERCVPADAGPVQVKESRQAFFAGAVIFQRTMMVTMSRGDQVTAEDMRFMLGVEAEIVEFGAELDLEVLKPTRQ